MKRLMDGLTTKDVDGIAQEYTVQDYCPEGWSARVAIAAWPAAVAASLDRFLSASEYSN